jgi:hypothetical protein
VVLYRFGEKPPAGFERLFAGELDVRNNPEVRLPYEYFLNRLYVAASRAKGRLIIVDSREAIDAFWRFATDADSADALITRVGGKANWRDKITFLVKGKRDWETGGTDPREQAREYESQGIRKRDSYLLRQAALAYRSASEEIKAGRCLALAFKFDGKLEEAGRKYQELKLYEDAFECYWKGKHFKLLCGLTSQDPTLATRLEGRAADFIEGASGIPTAFLTVVLDIAENDHWVRESAADATWGHVLGKLAERLAKATEADSERWREVHYLLEQLSAAGMALHESHRAIIAYRAREYGIAVQLWDAGGGGENEEYRRAKARLEPFPKNLVWFGKLKDYAQVLHEWEQRRHAVAGVKLEREVAFTITDAAIAKEEFHLALEMIGLHLDRGRLEAILSGAVKLGNAEAAVAAATYVTRLWVQTKAWNAAVKAAEDLDFAELKVEAHTLRRLINKVGGADKLLEAVTFELAVSEDLSAETTEKQAPVSEFLFRQFVRKERQLSIPIEVAGAAIERTGKIVYALQYYEPLYRNHSLPREKRVLAAQRYVRALEKYAEYFRSQGGQRQAEEREAHARRIRDEFGLGSKTLPDYPSIRRIAVATEDPTEWTNGPFKITLSRAYNRLRIEHTKLFETVTVLGAEHLLKGDARFSDMPLQAGIIAAWKIDDWDTTIRLMDVAGTIRIQADFKGDYFEVEIGSNVENPTMLPT